MRKQTSLRPHPVRTIRDRRGTLRIFEKDSSIPFSLKRCFVISGVPEGQSRAEHALTCDQFLVMLVGSCRLTFKDGHSSGSMTLSTPAKGVLLRKGVWLRLDRFSTGAHLLVCASQKYRAPRRQKQKTTDA